MPARGVPHAERQAGFHEPPGISLRARPFTAHAQEMAEYAIQARDVGINFIGACCGTVAMHIREMARVLNKIPEDSRIWKKGGEKPMSAYEYYDHDKLEAGKAK